MITTEAGTVISKGTNGSSLHDHLWCKAALGHLRQLFAERRKEGKPPLVLSLGPVLGRSFDCLAAALSSIVNRDPLVSARGSGAAAASSMTFDISPEEGVVGATVLSAVSEGAGSNCDDSAPIVDPWRSQVRVASCVIAIHTF